MINTTTHTLYVYMFGRLYVTYTVHRHTCQDRVDNSRTFPSYDPTDINCELTCWECVEEVLVLVLSLVVSVSGRSSPTFRIPRAFW